MMDRHNLGAVESATLLKAVARHCCSPCAQCAELDAEFHVELVIAGEACEELMCEPCASKATGLDLSAPPSLLDLACVYVAPWILDGCYRRTVHYRT
jgi:hypothetical protein